MLSSALSQVLERARTRFGLEVEILDGELRALYPEAGTEFSRSIRTNTELRQTLREVLLVGHPKDVEEAGERYRIYPLRQSGPTTPTGGLLAVKGSVPSAAAADATPWSEFARAAIEADLSAGDTLREQRQQSRRLLAILRFLRYLIESANEAELMQALVQAAAVWFDVDARVYRRDLSGDFVLQNWLPGVEPDQASRRLDVQVIGVDREVKRLAPSHELGGLASLGGETLVVPLAGLSRTDLVMTLSGAVPVEADSVFQVVGPVVGTHLDSIRSRRIDSARRRYESVISQPGLAAERIAVQIVAELVQSVNAGAASLTLVNNGDTRRIVSFGPPAEDPPSSGNTCVLTPDRFVCGLALGGEHQAVLELRPARWDEVHDRAGRVHDNLRASAENVAGWGGFVVQRPHRSAGSAGPRGSFRTAHRRGARTGEAVRFAPVARFNRCLGTVTGCRADAGNDAARASGFGFARHDQWPSRGCAVDAHRRSRAGQRRRTAAPPARGCRRSIERSGPEARAGGAVA